MSEIGRLNAIGFATLTNVYDPELITVGGSIAIKNSKLILNPIIKLIDQFNINRIPEIKGLENLTNLKYLNLEKNQIREIIGLKSLKKLELLAIKWNKIERISGLDNQHELKRLELSHNSITTIQGLENLDNLTNIDLRLNPVVNEIIKFDPNNNDEVLVRDLEATELVKYCKEFLRKK